MLLVAIMIGDAAPLGIIDKSWLVLHANAEEHSGLGGDRVNWTLDTDTGTLTISGIGEMNYWNYYHSFTPYAPWYSYTSFIKTVIIEYGVTTIANDAFFNCTQLKSITIPNSVTAIGNNAFYNCSSLSEIKLSDNLCHIGKNAFYGTALYIDAENWSDGALYIDNSLITTNRILSGTYAIREGTVCLADEALTDCKNISELLIPDSVLGFDAGMLSECSFLSAIHVDSNNPSYSSDENGILYDKEKALLLRCPPRCVLSQYSIPNSVQEIGNYAFYNCSSLKSIFIPDSTKEIGDSAFYGCDLLQSISIPNSVWGIGDNAFYSCTNLQSVSIPEGLRQISNSCFCYCRRLSTIILPSSITVIGENAFDSSGIKWISLGGNVKEIKRYAFNNTPIQNISFGSSITKIAEHAFGACFSLKSVCYSGTVEQWMEIEISSNANNALTVAPRYYHTHNPEMSTELRNTVEATCYRDGYSGDLVYLPCGAIKETGVIIPALGHDFVTTIPEPTCEYEVWGSVICSRCGTHDSGSEPRIPPLGHDWDDGIVTREATCVLSGITKYTCLRDSSHTRTEYTPAKGHMFGKWQETKAPTVDQPGEAQRRCSVCGKTETITLAKLPAPEKLTLNKTSVTLNYKDSEMLTASEAVTWSSSNEKVVKVDPATGKLTTTGKGSATITAHSVQGDKTATCEVTVKYTFIQMLIRIFLLGFIWY